MKEIYLDIIEKSLSAYSDERIAEYIAEVKEEGLTEHGFVRLGANMGTLIAYGRRPELYNTFVEIMDFCCKEIPTKKACNNFSVREVCTCLMLMDKKGVVDKDLFNKWKAQILSFDPWTCYDITDDNSGKFINNWAMFGAVSEYMRGVFCGIDTSEFVDSQIPSQLANLDDNLMYMDHPPYLNPALYDIIPRMLMAVLLMAGYDGKYAAQLEEVLDKTADITLKMQSVNGEFAFGGRSNQFIHNEAVLCTYCELEAARFYKKGDMQKAGQFKAAAKLAAQSVLHYLSLKPISHTKNRYDVCDLIGCENYGKYNFNNYMITTGSWAYLAILFGCDKVAPTTAPATQGGYVIQTSKNFHRVFLNNNGYFLQWDVAADEHCDANGLGRVHRAGCPSALCISTPFAKRPKYTIEGENASAMSLCAYAQDGDKLILGAERYAEHSLVKADSNCAEFLVRLSKDITVTENYNVSENGVTITHSGYKNAGFMVPVFAFDGKNTTKITAQDNKITVGYEGAECIYTFNGKACEHKTYYNRNGRYRVFKIESNYLHIELKGNKDA